MASHVEHSDIYENGSVDFVSTEGSRIINSLLRQMMLLVGFVIFPGKMSEHVSGCPRSLPPAEDQSKINNPSQESA